jgi:hypothetical protein
MGDVDAGKVKATVEVTYTEEGFEQGGDAIEALPDKLAALTQGAGDLNDALAGMNQQLLSSGDGAKEFTAALEALPKVTEDGNSAVSGMNDVLSGQQETIEAIQEPLKTYNESLQAVSETMGSGHFAENMSAFNNALDDPSPFTMISSYLDETGQNWQDFTSSIGGENTALLQGMGNTGKSAQELLDGMSAANAQGYIDQWNGVNDAVSETNKTLGETDETIGSVAKASNGGGFFSSLFSDTGEAEWLFGSGGIMGMLSDVAMPLMALQMIGMAVGSLGQGIYDAAAIAEGPGAHGIGSFTGAVDTLNKSVQQSGQNFSEQFGQGVLPALNGINNTNQSTQGGFDWGGWIGRGFGMEAGLTADTGMFVGGSMLGGLQRLITLDMLPEDQYTWGQGWIQSGEEGFQNYWADWTGQQEPYPTPNTGPAPIPFFDQQAIDSYYGVGNTPSEQAAYGVSHYGGTTGPSDPMNAIIQYELDNANGGAAGMTNPDPNAAWSNSFPPFGGGCFPAGTSVLLADGSSRAIESLQIGDCVLAHDGEKQVVTTVLARIVPPPKPVYQLIFDGGNTLTLTDSHPVMTAQGWKSLSPEATRLSNPDLEVTALVVGDTVHTSSGTVTLVSIQPREVVQIYNMEVSEPHTFYANKILVHNKALDSQIVTQTQSAAGGEFHWPPMPEIHWPSLPEIKWPSLPEIKWPSLPEIKWPSLPEIHWPSLPEIKWPSLPQIQWPSLPTIQWPSLPQIQWPSLPTIQWPSLPQITWPSLPEIHWPTLPEIHWPTLPEFHWPSLPTFQWPALPQFQWPPMPSLSLSMPAGLPLFASGVENFGGGFAIVGEAGPELVSLPGGSSVYPMSAGAGIGGGTSPISLGGGGSAPQSINVVVQIDSQAVLSAIGLPLSQNIRLSSGMRGF